MKLTPKTIQIFLPSGDPQGIRIAEITTRGSFGINYRPPRKGRNPKSGAAVMVPAKYTPHFKAGKELRERVDNNLVARV